MKFVYCFLSLLLIGFLADAQSKFPLVDKSPLDMSYYPDNYPLLKIQGKAKQIMRHYELQKGVHN